MFLQFVDFFNQWVTQTKVSALSYNPSLYPQCNYLHCLTVYKHWKVSHCSKKKYDFPEKYGNLSLGGNITSE